MFLSRILLFLLYTEIKRRIWDVFSMSAVYSKNTSTDRSFQDSTRRIWCVEKLDKVNPKSSFFPYHALYHSSEHDFWSGRFWLVWSQGTLGLGGHAILTVVVCLVRVGHQAAIIRAWGKEVRDAIIIIIIITLVTQSIFISVQLGAVYHQWTVVLWILMSVTITVEQI